MYKEGLKEDAQQMRKFNKTCYVVSILLRPIFSAFTLFIILPPVAFSASLQFVPPPMDGTISMGIYDRTDKLVRALHRADPIESTIFGKALNGLITSWDGKNEAGTLMPVGKYYARGYGVGDLAVNGEAMLGNDFIVNNDSPRIKRIQEVKSEPDGKMMLTTLSAADSLLMLNCDKSGAVILPKPADPTMSKDLNGNQALLDVPPPVLIHNGKVFIQSNELKIPAGIHPVEVCPAAEGGVWLIDHSDASTTDVKQFSSNGELIRRLAVQGNDPVPLKISMSGTDLILLEGNQFAQRLRELSLVTSGTATISGTEPATSIWKVIFSKTITFSDTLEQARSLLKFPDGKPFGSEETIKVALLPNPLMQDQPSSLEIGVGIDAEGSFLKTKEGLLLQRISNTPNLKWAALGHEPGNKIIFLFQSDGAVVEEYQIANPANMMAFDCGDFDFDPKKEK